MDIVKTYEQLSRKVGDVVYHSSLAKNSRHIKLLIQDAEPKDINIEDITLVRVFLGVSVFYVLSVN